MKIKSYLHVRESDGFILGKCRTTANPIPNEGNRYIEIDAQLFYRELLYEEGGIKIDKIKEKVMKDRADLLDGLEKKVDNLEPLTEEELRFYNKWSLEGEK